MLFHHLVVAKSTEPLADVSSAARRLLELAIVSVSPVARNAGNVAKIARLLAVDVLKFRSSTRESRSQFCDSASVLIQVEVERPERSITVNPERLAGIDPTQSGFANLVIPAVKCQHTWAICNCSRSCLRGPCAL